MPGVLIARVDGPLFFADADRFRTRMREIVGDASAPGSVVVDAAAVHLTDTDGADILIEIAGELESDGASLALARIESSILDLWRRAGVIDAIGADRIFHTVHEAVEALGPRR